MFQTTNQHLFAGSHFQTPTWRSSDTFVPKKKSAPRRNGFADGHHDVPAGNARTSEVVNPQWIMG